MKQNEISAMLKAEERHTSNLEPHEIGFAPLDFSAGWRACAEWRDSQVGEPVWEQHAKKLTQWLHCMSYNDSYFGEPAGLVKQVTHELYRLIGNTRPESEEVKNATD